MKRQTEIVSFRGDQSLLKRIDSACQPLELSRGEWVREVVISHFHLIEESVEWPGQLADLRLLVEQTDETTQQLLANDKRILFVVLTTVGGMTADQAKEAIRCKF